MKRRIFIALVSLVMVAGTYGVVSAMSGQAKACCCDFSNGKIVCTITGQELQQCCCK